MLNKLPMFRVGNCKGLLVILTLTSAQSCWAAMPTEQSIDQFIKLESEALNPKAEKWGCEVHFVSALGGDFPVPRRFHAHIPDPKEPRVIRYSSPAILAISGRHIPSGYIKVGPAESHWSFGRSSMRHAEGFELISSETTGRVTKETWEVSPKNSAPSLRGARVTVLHNGESFVEVYDENAQLPELLLKLFSEFREIRKRKDFDVSTFACLPNSSVR